jgi:hypothetical protein
MRLFAIIPSVCLILTASSLSATACAADTPLYKTVDAQGHVVYTDKAPDANTQQSTVHYHEPSAEALKSLDEQHKAQQAAEAQRLQQTAVSDTARAQQQKEQQARQARCDNARRYAASLKAARRLYDTDAQGERVFLTDQDADVKRAQADQAVIEACGS